jgi:hypothetical protein
MESLQGWRDYYCDSEDQWRGCARYRMSLTGERVPISLLPNGAQARYLEDVSAEQQQQQPQPQQHQQPYQQQPYGQPQQGGQYGYPADPYGQQQYQHQQPQPQPQQYQGQPPAGGPVSATIGASHRGAPAAPDRPAAKRGWWARFTSWMGGPA